MSENKYYLTVNNKTVAEGVTCEYQVTISALEKGRNSGGNLDTIELLADALGLSIDEYVGHEVIKHRERKK